VPATVDVASSCEVLKAVPLVMAVGVDQVIGGVAWFTFSTMALDAVAL
jgi:hypothetical protein